MTVFPDIASLRPVWLPSFFFRQRAPVISADARQRSHGVSIARATAESGDRQDAIHEDRYNEPNSLSGAHAMFVRSFACLACWCGLVLGASAEDSPEVIAARKARLKAMQQIAERFKVQAGEGEQRKKVPLIEAPILRFNDPAREFHDATLWAWGETGRPLCLLAVEQYGDRSWFEFIALSAQRFTAEAEALRWAPRASSVELRPFPDASRASDKAPQRLVQMKDLLGQLTAYELGRTGSRYELRLMPRPLYRYSDDKDELVDGAIFAFAYGTNPE